MGKFQNKRQTTFFLLFNWNYFYFRCFVKEGRGGANSVFNVQQQRVKLNFCVPQRGPLNKSRPEKALDSFQSDY